MAECSGSEVAAVGGAGCLGGINEGERAKVITAKLAAAALVSISCDGFMNELWTMVKCISSQCDVTRQDHLFSVPAVSPQTVQCGKIDKVQRR